MGCLVKRGEALLTVAIRNCRHLVNLRLAQNDRLYLVSTMDGFMDHEPFKTSFNSIIDVLFSNFKWRAGHHTPAMIMVVTDSINEALVTLQQLPGPLPPVEFPTSLTTELCGIFYEFFIYHWDDFNDKSKCFDYGELITTREIEGNFGY